MVARPRGGFRRPEAHRLGMSDFWERFLVAVVVIGIAALVAKLVDRRISRSGPRRRPPRRATASCAGRSSPTIIFVGILSALLVIPQVRAVATAILASSAVLGLVARLRRAAHDRELHRRPADRVHAAGAPRRRDRDRRRRRGRRGDRPHVHLGTNARERPARDPEREARVRDRSATPPSAARAPWPRSRCTSR